MTEQRVALVTGCAKKVGLGSAIARALAGTCAMDLILTDVDSGGLMNKTNQAADMDPAWGGLPSLVEEVQRLGVDAIGVVGDVSEPADVEAIVQAGIAQFGRIDVLVNNAAAPLRDERGDLETLDPSEWERVMAVNARGPFLMSRAVIPTMKSRGWGRIIMISSLAGRVGLPHSAIYCASKHAVIGFARSLSLDLAPHGITVNAVCPGQMQTTRALASARRMGHSDAEIQDELDRRAARIPVGRLGQPEDTAAAVAFLAGDATGFITGQTLGVDGGVLPA